MNHDDRSEKIITLARTMLQQPPPEPTQTYSLKTMVMVALLSAGTAGVGSALTVEHYRPLNRYERTELRALIFYAAKTHHLESTVIEKDFYLQFAVQSLDELTQSQLQEARQFLQNYIL